MKTPKVHVEHSSCLHGLSTTNCGISCLPPLPTVTAAQFLWLPRESQCSNCLKSWWPMPGWLQPPGVWPAGYGRTHASAEMQTTVESFVLAIYRLTVPVDESGRRRFPHERCFHRFIEREDGCWVMGESDCSCGLVSWTDGRWWRTFCALWLKPRGWEYFPSTYDEHTAAVGDGRDTPEALRAFYALAQPSDEVPW